MPEVALLPYQQRWLGDKSQVKLCEKSRRVGLSWGQAAGAALMAAKANGRDHFYIGYNREMAREFIDDVAFWARHYQAAAEAIQEEVFKDEDKDILSFRIQFASGFQVVALSSRPSNLRGRQGDVTIDEAAFHPDLGELLKAAMALLMWGGSVSVISTHNGVDNPFNELVKDTQSGKLPYSLHTIPIDDALREGLYKRICLKLGRKWSQEAEEQWREDLFKFYGDAAQEELLCIPRNSGGAYIPRTLIERRMTLDTPVVRYTCPEDFALVAAQDREAVTQLWLGEQVAGALAGLDKNLNHYYGLDFAREGDLSVMVILAEQINLARHWVLMIEMRRVPYEQQRQILFWVTDRLPRFSGGKHDATGNGGYLGEVAQQRYGAALVEPIKLSEQWYREWMPRFKAAFEDERLYLPKNADLLQDLREISVVRGVPLVPRDKRSKGSDGQLRHGDAAIAGALAWAASESGAVPIEFQALPGATVGAELAGFARYSDRSFGGYLS